MKSAPSLLLLLLAGCSAGAPPPDDPAPANELSSPDAGPAYVTRGPEEVEGEAWGVGRQVQFDYTDLQGERGSLSELCRGAPGAVVVFTSIECPVTRLYAPVLAERAPGWLERGLKVLAVAPAAQDTDDELRQRGERLGWTFPVARDPGHVITEALRAERTADVFLLDGDGRLVYRGAIDDQYGINYRRVSARHTYLKDAIAALLVGESPPVTATTAPGCLLR